MKRVLFVCVENSNRSQMAEAFARMHGGAAVEAYSAGSRPSGKVNPRAVEFMGEVGYDLTKHRSKGLTDLPPGEFAAVIGMGVMQAHQNKGVGSKLLAALIDLADNWYGLARLELSVFTDNLAAVSLYKKFGFRIEGTLVHFAFREGQYADVYLMARLRVPR